MAPSAWLLSLLLSAQLFGSAEAADHGATSSSSTRLSAAQIGSLKDGFVTNYNAVVDRLLKADPTAKGSPDKTHPPTNYTAPAKGCPTLRPGAVPACGFQWSVGTGWTSGFFPGLLWQIANETNDQDFATAAAKFTAAREVEKTSTSTHDVGFMVFGSFGNGVLLGNHNVTAYTSVIVETAHSLAKRYNAKVGMTRSWGDINDGKQFEVIIDNLMNLELLFWASAVSGNKTLGEIATSHATRTAELWFRPDNSTAHLCVFDPATGKLQSPCTGTPQGLAANSTWARGQGWAVYGFTMAYRYTQKPEYLQYAEGAADYYLKNSGEDLVPLWDYDAVAPAAFKDTSAAAIVASGLLELAVHTSNNRWHDEAMSILYSLGTEAGLFAPPGSQSESILIANRHDCDFNSCVVIETEYYLYEALRRVEGHFPPPPPVNL